MHDEVHLGFINVAVVLPCICPDSTQAYTLEEKVLCMLPTLLAEVAKRQLILPMCMTPHHHYIHPTCMIMMCKRMLAAFHLH